MIDMKKFRVNRKDKKKIKKLSMLFYPKDKDGNSLSAHPLSRQRDYDAYKRGELESLMGTKKEQSLRMKEMNLILDKETVMTESELLDAVNDVFAKEYREHSYNSLLRAYNSTNKKKYYYNFVNAYLEAKKGRTSYFNTCCITIDFIDGKY